jgi:protocatechuate 3,4-dioxygenase beta subunit
MRSIILLVLSQVAGGVAAAQSAHVAPENAPARVAVTPSSEPGERLAVSGRVLGDNNQPVPGASIYVYQTDTKGEYVQGSNRGNDRPRLFGFLRSDSQGRYSFTTIRPGSYPNSRIPGHIHFEVTAPGHAERIYEIVFEGDPFISDQFRSQARQPFGNVEIVTARKSNEVFEVSHDVRIRPR